MRALLEELGLTGYEATALAHLIQHGVRTGPELSREAGIPFGRVYDTLNQLAERHLVVIEAGRPKRYQAVPPATVPRRLLAANLRRLSDQESRMQQRVQELESAVSTVAPKADPGRDAYGVRMGEESAREFLIEATHEARDHIVAFLAFDEIHDDDLRIFAAFQAAVDRGLTTRILLRSRDVDYLMGTPYVDEVLDAMLPHLGHNLQVRLTWSEAMPFAAIDGERAMLGVKNPLEPSAYFGVIHVEDAGFSGGLTAHFDALWHESDEPREILQRLLSKKGGRALARIGARLRSAAAPERNPSVK